MSRKSITELGTTDYIGKSDYVFLEVGGSIRKMTLEDFIKNLRVGDLNLRQYAWGIKLPGGTSNGSWEIIGNKDLWQSTKNQLGRYLITTDGTRMAKLNKTNSNYFADGTEIDKNKGEIMFYGPKIYYLFKQDAETGINYLWGSTMPISGKSIDELFIGAYPAYCDDDNTLHSRSDMLPTTGLDITTYWTNARKLGKNWGLADYNALRYLTMISLFEYGTVDVQTKIGPGVGNNDSEITGATNSLGDICGSYNNHVNLFGVEDYWGWYGEMLQGIYGGSDGNLGQSGTELFIYSGNKLPNQAEIIGTPNGNFRQISKPIPEQMGYIKRIQGGPYFDVVPSIEQDSLEAESNSYWHNSYSANSSGQLVVRGGQKTDISSPGIITLDISKAFNSSNENITTRLAFYGKPNLVDGKDF